MGVTPSALVIIVALVVVRIVSSSADQLVAIDTAQALAAYVRQQSGGLKSIFSMVVTMMAVIVLTGNLGPKHGSARAIALVLANLAGSSLGVLTRMIVWNWLVNP
ncbi:MAG TPA: hypothetical protein VGL43_04215, partial [Casimicrobiaceae bacterium]